MQDNGTAVKWLLQHSADSAARDANVSHDGSKAEETSANVCVAYLFLCQACVTRADVSMPYLL